MPSMQLEKRGIKMIKRKKIKLPVKEMVAIASCMFVFAFSGYIVEPIFPFMTKSFLPHLAPEEIGLYSGLLFSAFYLGNLVGGPIFGWIGDKYGRRPCLILASFGVIFFVVWFGFSSTFLAAVIARCLWGLFNGNIATARAALGELAPPTRQAEVFGLITLTYGIGFSIGPTCGGLLSNPAQKFPMFKDSSLLIEFPFALPCLFAACLGLVAAVLVTVYVPETINNKTAKLRSPREINWSSLTLVMINFFCVASMVQAQFTIVPLWSLNTPESHGIDFTSQDIGFLFGISGLIMIPNQLFVFPRLCKKYGLFFLLRLTLVGQTFGSLLLPLTTFIVDYKALMWAVLVLAQSTFITCASFCMSTSLILINNSATMDTRGRVNGFAQLFGDGGRIITPIVVAPLFAAIMEIAPSAWYFSFLWFQIPFSVLPIVLSYKLPEHLDPAWEPGSELFTPAGCRSQFSIPVSLDEEVVPLLQLKDDCPHYD